MKLYQDGSFLYLETKIPVGVLIYKVWNVYLVLFSIDLLTAS